MLARTLEHMFTQAVVIERDMSEPDRFGAESTPDWQALDTVRCALWWWKGSKSTAKSASDQYARPQATYDETGGDLALPLGTDVATTDRIGEITTLDTGEVLEEGPFRIVSVNTYETHIELSLLRP